ncbi:MAG: ammonium transporter [Chloroflexi bacterium]|nr:ammonium transporter [Chloroflexota bacterium]
MAMLAGTALGVAAQQSQVDTGDTAWVLMSTALVMIMTPALGFFYAGMVRRKNALSVIMHSFIILAIISVQWVLWGYSLAFGPDKGGIIGGLEWVGLRTVGAEPNATYAGTIPHQAFMVFQMMFAVITPALITGAFAERMKFSTFVVFVLLWATLVYDPMAHWVWADGGWLRKLGTLDFAGGTVVHINSGVAALAAAIVMGKRLGFGKDPMEPHDITATVLGAAFLWFGWFGFNAGSAVASGALATSAFVATNTAAAMAAIAWMGMTWRYVKKPSVLGAASGAVAGLVAITPASGYVSPLWAVVIGLGAGVFCYLAVRLRAKLGLDDSLDVWGVHGIGGTWGAIATGLFASTAVNAAGSGAVDGNWKQVLWQLIAVGSTWGYSFGMTFLILKVLDKVMGLRVKEDEEARGLDISQHGEPGYSM